MMSKSPRRRGIPPFDEPDTVFVLPGHLPIGVGRCLLLAALFAGGMWNLATGAGGWDTVPAIVRILGTIVCAALAQSCVRGAFGLWQTHGRDDLGPAAERIDSHDTLY
ncbi:hypothetical protein [Mycobacterium sp. SMC-18]|uniref:hypothetical protein n=2 Tax=unclassified Mycobacterium TaxID=2642494 RepID=UPI003878132A